MSKKITIPKSVLKTKIKEYFDQNGEDIAHIYQLLESKNKMPYYDGIFSLVHTEKTRNGSFVFTPETVKQGYFDLKGRPTLNLIDGKRKVILSLSNSIYHFLGEDIAQILQIFNEGYEDLEIVIDVSAVAKHVADRGSMDMFAFFLETLNDKKIKNRIVDLNEFDIIYIDNFFVGLMETFPMYKYLETAEYFSEYITEKNVVPDKKVYLSRKNLIVPDSAGEYTDSNGEEQVASVSRIDDEPALEKIFESMGFEVIYPEDFLSFDDQINFFNSVKVLASLTSSGISNAIFMQPGCTIVEMITPLTVQPISQNGDRGDLNREFHNYYKNIATTMDLLYIGIPNTKSETAHIKKFFKNNKHLIKMLADI